MELFASFLDYFLHLDEQLNLLIQEYGTWVYLILFVVIFCETGLVLTPILPGDSLLFAVGAFAAIGALDLPTVLVLLTIAAIAGDAVNYTCGYYIGPKVFRAKENRFFRREYLERTQRFYERHGGKTIILARFIPIVRTFAPFVAGVGKMSYSRFALYNIVGAISWVSIFVALGYGFGNTPIVRNNVELFALGIVFFSVLPLLIEAVRSRLAAAS